MQHGEAEKIHRKLPRRAQDRLLLCCIAHNCHLLIKDSKQILLSLSIQSYIKQTICSKPWPTYWSAFAKRPDNKQNQPNYRLRNADIPALSSTSVWFYIKEKLTHYPKKTETALQNVQVFAVHWRKQPTLGGKATQNTLRL